MKIAIIGAGAAGLMAAASINDTCPNGHEALVTVFEKNEKAGKKIYITGKGRCNFTNDCQPAEFLSSVVTNPKFLYSAIYSFTPKNAIDFMENNGCPTKVERGGRAFPISDKASDITKALVYAASKCGAQIRYQNNIKKIASSCDGFVLTLSEGEQLCYDRLIIATGGKSYPSTGSTGDGYSFARMLGHTVVQPRPALVALKLIEDVSSIEGLSLKNVEVELKIGGKKYKEFGEMLFTRNGVSGPIILSLSSYLANHSRQAKLDNHIAKLDSNIAKTDSNIAKLDSSIVKTDSGVAKSDNHILERSNADIDAVLSINLKPALDAEALDKRVLRDFSEFSNKQLKNSLDKLLPKSLISFIIDYASLDGTKPVNLISRAERQRLTDALSRLTFKVASTCGFEEAIITSGGVSVKEINPSTMESKIVSGLYFAGEVIDVDALTGGYNMQIALSTGYLAGKSASTK